jgi:hypothetical protein
LRLTHFNVNAMQLIIEKGQTVLDVRHQFGDSFPGLKVELFKKSHDDGESSSAKMRVLGTEIVDELVNVSLPINLDISPNMTVSEVETTFEEQTGMHVQVFRKMRNIWIETVQTDGYSLADQMDLSLKSVS